MFSRETANGLHGHRNWLAWLQRLASSKLQGGQADWKYKRADVPGLVQGQEESMLQINSQSPEEFSPAQDQSFWSIQAFDWLDKAYPCYRRNLLCLKSTDLSTNLIEKYPTETPRIMFDQIFCPTVGQPSWCIKLIMIPSLFSQESQSTAHRSNLASPL
jgi:hypothetical protein